MTSLARCLAAVALIFAPAGYLAEAQLRPAPFARPPVLPPTVIPIPLAPLSQPFTPLPPAPAGELLPLPGPVFGSPPPPPPPLGSQYWSTLWAELDPLPCEIAGLQRLPEGACDAVDVARLLWSLRDPSRQSEVLKELARKMARQAIRIRFNEGDPLEFRAEAVEAIYAALQAEFDNVLDHAGQALMDAPAPTLLRRAYAIADAVAVEDMQMRVAAETRQNLQETVSEVRSHPERQSANLFNEGLAYRQVVAGSLGREIFDSF